MPGFFIPLLMRVNRWWWGVGVLRLCAVRCMGGRGVVGSTPVEPAGVLATPGLSIME